MRRFAQDPWWPRFVRGRGAVAASATNLQLLEGIAKALPRQGPI
jgi:hypothetical protein